MDLDSSASHVSIIDPKFSHLLCATCTPRSACWTSHRPPTSTFSLGWSKYPPTFPSWWSILEWRRSAGQRISDSRYLQEFANRFMVKNLWEWGKVERKPFCGPFVPMPTPYHQTQAANPPIEKVFPTDMTETGQEFPKCFFVIPYTSKRSLQAEGY